MLTQGLVKKKYTILLVASLLGWIVALVGELADSILAGQFISEEAVSATGLVAPLFSFSFFFSVMIGLGSANNYAIKNGRFEKDEAYKTAGQALLLAFIAGIAFALLMYIGEDTVFAFYGASSEVEAYAREYYDAIAILTAVAPMFWSIYYLVSIDGNAVLVLASDIIQAFGNFGVSLVLVQKIGIKGLAYGSIISVIMSWLILIPHFFSKKNSIHFKLSLSWKRIKTVMLSGSTIAMTSVYIGIVDIVFNKFILVKFGDPLLASYAIINLILNLAQISGCASDAASGFIGTYYAEGNPVSMKKILRMIIKVMFVVSGLLMILFFIFAKFAPAVYGIENLQAYEAAIYSTKVLALSYIPSAFIFMYLSYLPKIEKPALGNLAGFLYSLATPIAIALPLGCISYNAMSWGFFLTPVVSLVIVGLIILKKYGKGNFPYPIPETNAQKIFNYEFAATNEEVSIVKDLILDELKASGVGESISNKLAMMVEETFMVVKLENEKKDPKRKVLCDATVMIYEDKVVLITRDNGIIFDITQVDMQLTSFEAYVAAVLMENDDENSNVTSVSFNRNYFSWKR